MTKVICPQCKTETDLYPGLNTIVQHPDKAGEICIASGHGEREAERLDKTKVHFRFVPDLTHVGAPRF